MVMLSVACIRTNCYKLLALRDIDGSSYCTVVVYTTSMVTQHKTQYMYVELWLCEISYVEYWRYFGREDSQYCNYAMGWMTQESGFDSW
jgi:hypothetical protein